MARGTDYQHAMAQSGMVPLPDRGTPTNDSCPPTLGDRLVAWWVIECPDAGFQNDDPTPPASGGVISGGDQVAPS